MSSRSAAQDRLKSTQVKSHPAARVHEQHQPEKLHQLPPGCPVGKPRLWRQGELRPRRQRVNPPMLPQFQRDVQKNECKPMSAQMADTTNGVLTVKITGRLAQPPTWPGPAPGCLRRDDRVGVYIKTRNQAQFTHYETEPKLAPASVCARSVCLVSISRQAV